MNKFSKRIFFLLLLCLISIFLSVSHASNIHTVKGVIDGETILLENNERVRLVGVDTPEVYDSDKLHRDAGRTQGDKETIRKLGKRASAFTKKMVQGKQVRLEYDQANAHIGHRDRYGRILAYVFLEDGTLVNAEIVRQGYGVAYTKYPFKYAEEFRKFERDAREKRTGLWGR